MQSLFVKIQKTASFVFCFISALMFGQCTIKDERDVILDETFDDNSGQWMVGQWGNRKAEIETGYLSMETDSSGMILSNNSLLDSTKDFHLETTIEKISGDDLTYGIALNNTEKDNLSYYFLIGPSREIVICKSNDKDTDYYYYLPVTVYADLNVEVDTFEIDRKGEQTSFYLNRKKIITIDAPVMGNLTEYSMHRAGNIRVHNLKIRQTPKQEASLKEVRKESQITKEQTQPPSKDSYRVIITYLPKDAEPTEDWGFFNQDVDEAFKEEGIYFTMNQMDDVNKAIIKDDDKNIYIEIDIADILKKNDSQEQSCYIFVEKGREQEFAPYAPSFETIAKARKYFGLPESPDER